MNREAILEEIRQCYLEQASTSEIQEDDITYADLMETFKISRDTAQALGKRLEASGNFIKLKLRGPNHARVAVFRRVGL